MANILQNSRDYLQNFLSSFSGDLFVSKADLDKELYIYPEKEYGYNNTSPYNQEYIDYGIDSYTRRGELLNLQGFQKAERFYRDPQVRACLGNLVGSVISKKFQLEQADSSLEAKELKLFMENVLREMDGNIYGVFKLLAKSGAWYGYSLAEKVYKLSDNPKYKGMYVYKEIKQKKPGVYSFSLDDFDNIINVNVLIENILLPKEKFVIFTYDKDNGNPYGNGLFNTNYRFVEAKNELLIQMLIASKKLSEGSLWGKIKNWSNSKIRDKIKEALRAAQAGNPIVTPEDVDINLLSAKISQSKNPFVEILKFLDAQIALGIQGNTLSNNESQGTGTYAMSETHMGITTINAMVLERELCELFDEQITAPLLQWNFPEDKYPKCLYPTSGFNAIKHRDLKTFVDNVDKLTTQGYMSSDSEEDFRFVRDVFGATRLDSKPNLEIKDPIA